MVPVLVFKSRSSGDSFKETWIMETIRGQSIGASSLSDKIALI